MDPVTALEVYGALFEVYKAYATRNMILAGLIGFTLGITVSMLIALGTILKSDKKKKKKDEE